jgi:hypothetical protein
MTNLPDGMPRQKDYADRPAAWILRASLYDRATVQRDSDADAVMSMTFQMLMPAKF